MGRGEQDWKLDRPEDKVADHLLGRDADGLWDVVGDIEVRRPNCADALSHGCGSGIGLNGMPKERSNHADNDGEAGKVPSEGGAHGDREGNVEASADNTVEDEGYCAADRSKDDAVYSLAPVKVRKWSRL